MSGDPFERNKLLKLASIAHKFNEAVVARFESPDYVQKFRAAVTKEEMVRLSLVTAEMEEAEFVASETGDPDGKMLDIIAERAITFTDIFAGISARVLPQEELASMMPREGRNKETAAAFEKRGAKNLAKLCVK